MAAAICCAERLAVAWGRRGGGGVARAALAGGLVELARRQHQPQAHLRLGVALDDDQAQAVRQRALLESREAQLAHRLRRRRVRRPRRGPRRVGGRCHDGQERTGDRDSRAGRPGETRRAASGGGAATSHRGAPGGPGGTPGTGGGRIPGGSMNTVVRFWVVKYCLATRWTSSAVTFWYWSSSWLTREASPRMTAALPMGVAFLSGFSR